VTIDEFLKRLNEQARLPSNKIITARMLEDWAYEYLIPRPTRGGGTRKPNWQWPEESYEAALKVVDYRERGFKRIAAIRAQGWLENQRFLSAVVPRIDLIREFERARNLLIRYVSSTHGLRADTTLSEYKRRALLHQIGPLDPIFERAGINPGGVVFILLYELARFGEQITPLDENNEPLASALAKAVLPNGLHIFAGLLETDDTHPLSAVLAIRNLTSHQLEECRTWVATFPLALALGQSILSGLIKVPEKIRAIDAAYSIARDTVVYRWPWMIFTFTATANMMYKSQLSRDDCF
jgi:hypothetical protein